MRAVRRKRPEIELETIIRNQDNAPPIRAASTLMDIDFLRFERPGADRFQDFSMA